MIAYSEEMEAPSYVPGLGPNSKKTIPIIKVAQMMDVIFISKRIIYVADELFPSNRAYFSSFRGGEHIGRRVELALRKHLVNKVKELILQHSATLATYNERDAMKGITTFGFQLSHLDNGPYHAELDSVIDYSVYINGPLDISDSRRLTQIKQQVPIPMSTLLRRTDWHVKARTTPVPYPEHAYHFGTAGHKGAAVWTRLRRTSAPKPKTLTSNRCAIGLQPRAWTFPIPRPPPAAVYVTDSDDSEPETTVNDTLRGVCVLGGSDSCWVTCARCNTCPCCTCVCG